MPDNASGDSSQRKAAGKNHLGAEYARIEEVLSETRRGRWFLAEHARRIRGADTRLLLEAIAKLELAILRSQRQQGPCSVLFELLAMREAIARTRHEIAALKLPDQFESQLAGAREDLDQIVEATERATSDISLAAEEIQEVAWLLRERGAGIGFCDALDRRAIDLYAACFVQGIAGQRTNKALDVLRFVERRINIMTEIWGGGDVSPELPADIAETSVPTAHPHAAAENHPPRKRPGSEALQTFEAPEPLRLATLAAVKRAALFG